MVAKAWKCKNNFMRLCVMVNVTKKCVIWGKYLEFCV